MNSWNDVSTFVVFTTKGITPRYVKKSSIVVLNQKCIRNNRIDYSFAQFTDDSKTIPDTKFVRKGDILVNSTGTGTAGRSAFVVDIPQGHRLIVDSHILILRCHSYYEAQCLSYELFSFEKELMSFMTGSSGQSELDKVILLSIKTRMPTDSKSQELISSALFSLDAKIDINLKCNTEIEGMARRIFEYWFIQFEFPSESGLPYKSSGGKMVYNKELDREIPVGWDGGAASKLFDFNPSLSIKKNAIASYIDMNALPESGFMTGEVQRKEFNGGVKFQNGDLVIARITPCLENGKTGLITLLNEDEVGFGSTEFIVLRGKNQPLSSFAACLSRSELFRKYAITNMTGTSGRKRVEADTMARFPMAIPPDHLLEEFENTVGSFFKVATNNVKQNQQLAELRAWLLPMLMNGQVKVADINGELAMAAEEGVEYKTKRRQKT